jgi:regulator of protease activity HflC (stomatin/prohibitin superfamily)
MSAASRAIRGSLSIGFVLVVVIALALLVASGFRIVDASETCAVTRWGKLLPPISNGLHWRVPVMHRFHCFSVREVVYETSREPGLSGQDFTGTVVDTQTADGQTIRVAYSIVFSVPAENASKVYSEVGATMGDVMRRVVETVSRSEVRNALRSYTAERLYSGDVYAAQTKISEQLESQFERSGIALHNFLIREIDFDDAYIDAIEQQQIAEEQVQTAAFEADRALQEAIRARNIAKGSADATIEVARGEAESVRIRAEAQAEANRRLAESLTPALIQYEQLQVWDGKLPLYSGAATPLIQLPGVESPPAAP